MASSNVTGVQIEINPQIFQNPTLAFLKSYWDEKRGARTMPSRADIHPSEMKAHLRWILLMDVLPGGEDFRFRAVGTRVSDYFLVDVSGKSVSDGFAPFGPEAVEAVKATHRKVVAEGVVLRAYGGAGIFGRAFLDLDAIYLPLSEDGLTVNMILSAFTFDMAALLKAREADPPASP